MKKLISLLSILILVISFFLQETQASTVNTKKSRVTYTLKDNKGKKCIVYVIPTSEKKARGSNNAKYGWNTLWAGVNEGDLIYHGNYKLYIKKSGKKNVSYTGFKLKNYTYNATRKMMYSIPSKQKGQPDLFIISGTESSNFEYCEIYYIQNGKLKKAKDAFEYTLRPHNIGKNKYQVPAYNNANGKWYISDFKLALSSGKLEETQVLIKIYKNMDKFIKGWRKDWK
ncbi:hypothetical protein B4102_4003 [Heyndrickxia sporothermodurans]|uniref:Uncharacterized protein n=1 Tax=Heyndrickxia sporothermodurans TaxID=46224 RepID=A0A150KK49_9BACI|nr:hypothetical protein [Heyndrickxia sporothermodurans]KYC88614.1 hypothetical protein B4102_4003 [Heyndrickxia sporothermodurans]